MCALRDLDPRHGRATIEKQHTTNVKSYDIGEDERDDVDSEQFCLSIFKDCIGEICGWAPDKHCRESFVCRKTAGSRY